MTTLMAAQVKATGVKTMMFRSPVSKLILFSPFVEDLAIGDGKYSFGFKSAQIFRLVSLSRSDISRATVELYRKSFARLQVRSESSTSLDLFF